MSLPDVVFEIATVCNRLCNRPYVFSMALPLGRELLGAAFHGCGTCLFASPYYTVIGTSSRKVMHSAAQAQGFVKVTRLRRSYFGLAVSGWCFRGVELRCYIPICRCKVASKAPFLRHVSGKTSILRKACEGRNGQNHSERRDKLQFLMSLGK